MLSSHGANADAVNYDGVPVLHISIDLGYRDVMLMLLRHNATVNRRLYQYMSRLDADIRVACGSLFCNYITPLMLAALRGRTSFVEPLVVAGASVHHVVRLLEQPAAQRLLPALSADERLVQWLRDRSATVTSLQHISRLVVRASLRSPVCDVICELPLPRALLDFVSFCDLDDIRC